MWQENEMSKKLTSHNVEQAARAFASFELARRGYVVQPTDSRFPTEDLLVVSPNGKHFGIDIKGQKTKNFWIIKEPKPSDEFFYYLVFVPPTDIPDIYIIESQEMYKLWHEYKNRMIANGSKEDGIWGINWTTPFPYKDNWDVIPK
ncbi:MAG: hypothetical protein JRD05_10645 [Deltaproteobacteria bacterium]|nr:hypothetical protein [Deltaproteobacteria bacterium]